MTERLSVDKFNSNLIKGAAPDVYLYVLRLRSPPGEPPRYYVGSALDHEERLRAHFAGVGAAFTKRYPPVELVELRRGDRFDEDSMTRRLMAEHGIEYVRGGAYTRVQLSAEDSASLQLEIRAAAGLCTGCGRAGHFAVSCRAAPAAATAAVPIKLNEITQAEIGDRWARDRCDRCGRGGHAASECRTQAQNINCKNCHRRGHRTDACRIIKQEVTISPDGQNRPIYTCFRCGYRGHTSNVCTSKFDLDGDPVTGYNKYYPKTGYSPATWRRQQAEDSSDSADSSDSSDSADSADSSDSSDSAE